MDPSWVAAEALEVGSFPATARRGRSLRAFLLGRRRGRAVGRCALTPLFLPARGESRRRLGCSDLVPTPWNPSRSVQHPGFDLIRSEALDLGISMKHVRCAPPALWIPSDLLQGAGFGELSEARI